MVKKMVLTVAAAVCVLALAAGLVYFLLPQELGLPGMERAENRILYTLDADNRLIVLAPHQEALTLDREIRLLYTTQMSEAIMYMTTDGKIYVYDQNGERSVPNEIDADSPVFKIFPGGEKYFYTGRDRSAPSPQWYYRIGSIKEPQEYKDIYMPYASIWSPYYSRAVFREEDQFFLFDWEQKQPVTLPQGAQPVAVSENGKYIYSHVKNGETENYTLYVQDGPDEEAILLCEGYKELILNIDGTQAMFTDGQDRYYMSCNGGEAEFLLQTSKCSFAIPQGRVLYGKGNVVSEIQVTVYYTETIEGMILVTEQGYYRLGKTEKSTRLVLSQDTKLRIGQSGRNAVYVSDGKLYYAADFLSDAEGRLIAQGDDISVVSVSPDLQHVYYSMDGQQYYANTASNTDPMLLEQDYTAIVYSYSYQKTYYIDAQGKLYSGAAGETPQEVQGVSAVDSIEDHGGGQLFAYNAKTGEETTYRSIDGEHFTDLGLPNAPGRGTPFAEESPYICGTY